MSGITGIFYRDHQTVNSDLIKKINNKLSHRGPDGCGTWNGGPVGFGHQMLYSTPESLYENQPLEDKEFKLVITADVRIDNRNELIEYFNLDSIRTTDSELILKSYIQWGADCPRKLIGDYAFAILDKDSEKIFCARDHIGVKPFYYYLSPDLFVFATEIKAILTIPEISSKINETAIADYLLLLEEDKEITFYEGIYRLPPAHTLTITSDDKKIKHYWSLEPNIELDLDSDEEYSEMFFSVFHEAVKCRTRRAFPIASYLSGGLDSSSVVCTAHEILKEDNDSLQTFSAVFPDVPECDEQKYIKTVTDQCDLDFHLIRGDNITPFIDFDKVLWHADEPFNSLGYFQFYNLYKAAQKKGIRILLDGFGGDEVISHGSEFLIELARSKQLRKLFREVKMISNKKSYVNSYELLLNSVVIPLLPPKLKIVNQFFHRGSKLNHTKKMFRDDFSERIDLKERILSMNKSGMLFYPAKTQREYHFRLLNLGYIQHTLEDHDKILASFFIEPRYPFLDRRLMELCLALPPDQKLRDGWGRIVMRYAMDGLLPKKNQWRAEKTNLAPNVDHCLMNYAVETLDKVIVNDHTVLNNYLEMEYIREIHRRVKSGKDNTFKTLIWKTTALGLWLRNLEKNFTM